MRFRKITALLLIVALLCTAMAAGAEQVWDDDEFEQRIGIDFDGDDLNGGDVRMSIIDGNIGEVSYLLENVNGENVRWTVRFTRNQGYASAGILSGIPESEMSEPLDLSGNGINLTLRAVYSRGTDVYFWNEGRNCYCLIIGGLYSNMQFAAQMDQIVEACH